MITRIVRMEFEPEKVDEFLSLFERTSPLIRKFPGVNNLQLHRDLGQSNVFYTISEWDSEDSLKKYRESELFIGVWDRTKKMFMGKAVAYSMAKK